MLLSRAKTLAAFVAWSSSRVPIIALVFVSWGMMRA